MKTLIWYNSSAYIIYNYKGWERGRNIHTDDALGMTVTLNLINLAC